MKATQDTATLATAVPVQAKRTIEEAIVQSRFGKVTVTEKGRVFFPYGLAGIPDKVNFCITQLPSEVRLEGFELLQSLDDLSLSFVVLPLAQTNNLIDREDVKEACKTLAIAEEDLLILLIASVHKEPDSTRLSVNTRAPVMVDVKNKLAAQYIFMNNKYEVRQYL
jgi:flagellar assembly factor FliW